MFHRLAMHFEPSTKVRSLSICFNCKLDLTDIPSKDLEETSRSNEIRRLIETSIDNNSLCQLLGINHPVLLYKGLRSLIFLLCRQSSSDLRKQVTKDFHLPNSYADFLAKRVEFEFCPLSIRHQLISMLSCLLVDWPNYFIFAAKKGKSSMSDFGDRFANLPYWIIQACSPQLSLSSYIQTNEEIKSIVLQLISDPYYLSGNTMEKRFGLSQQVARQVARFLKKHHRSPQPNIIEEFVLHLRNTIQLKKKNP